MRMLLVTYGLGVGTNYLVVFVLLVIIYNKILKKIKKMRMKFGKCCKLIYQGLEIGYMYSCNE